MVLAVLHSMCVCDLRHGLCWRVETSILTRSNSRSGCLVMVSHSVPRLPPAQLWWVATYRLTSHRQRSRRLDLKSHTKKSTKVDKAYDQGKKKQQNSDITNSKTFRSQLYRERRGIHQDSNRGPTGLPEAYLPTRLRGFLLFVGRTGKL
jgi:hypothetical protein